MITFIGIELEEDYYGDGDDKYTVEFCYDGREQFSLPDEDETSSPGEATSTEPPFEEGEAGSTSMDFALRDGNWKAEGGHHDAIDHSSDCY